MTKKKSPFSFCLADIVVRDMVYACYRDKGHGGSHEATVRNGKTGKVVISWVEHKP
jgi:hypothetical protein